MSGDPDPSAVDLGPAGAELLASLGSPVRRARVLTPLRSPVTPRLCYRVDLADGRTVKLRRSATEARARRYVRLVTGLGDPRLARVLARRGDVTLEEWVPGISLDRVEVRDEHVRAGAALLGAVHSAVPSAGRSLPGTVSTDRARREIEADLRTLLGARAIDPDLARRLRWTAARHDPGVARAGIVHVDLCPENLVVDPGGALRAVDNEAMRIGFAGFDLARVWYRWPMSPTVWDGFVREYARLVDPRPALAHFAFWKIAAVLHSARARVKRGIAVAASPLERLPSLAEAP